MTMKRHRPLMCAAECFGRPLLLLALMGFRQRQYTSRRGRAPAGGVHCRRRDQRDRPRRPAAVVPRVGHTRCSDTDALRCERGTGRIAF